MPHPWFARRQRGTSFLGLRALISVLLLHFMTGHDSGRAVLLGSSLPLCLCDGQPLPGVLGHFLKPRYT